MKKETYLAWLPCDERGCYGVYDGCLEPQAKGVKVGSYLKRLLRKADGALATDEIWEIDAGTWYFGADAVKRIESELPA